jgi:hypothetical protein
MRNELRRRTAAVAALAPPRAAELELHWTAPWGVFPGDWLLEF